MKILRWLHRWLGIVLGLFITIVGLSGSWLIYDRELAEPDHAVVAGNAQLPLGQLYALALPLLPSDTNISVRFPRNPETPLQIWAGETQVVIDQYRGKVLQVREAEFWPYGWMFHLHKELLLGKPGETYAGWMGVGVLLIVLSGIVLWWPRKWKQALQLRRHQGRPIFWRDLHKQLGIMAAPFLLLAVITGVSLSFSDWVSAAASWLWGSGKTTPMAQVKPAATDRAQPGLDEMVRRANEALPGGRVGIMTIPASPEKPVVVRKQMPQDPHPNGLNFVYLDTLTAEVLQVIPLSQAEPARRWFNWAYPLHTGEALQPWHHWVLLVVGLLPTLLFVTGGYLYLRRKGKFGRG
jgi:uncharacterized iron-regulated membrane protein